MTDLTAAHFEDARMVELEASAGIGALPAVSRALCGSAGRQRRVADLRRRLFEGEDIGLEPALQARIQARLERLGGRAYLRTYPRRRR